jgi:hypothetical protein
MSVPMNVTSRTRTGIAYQRGERGLGGMLLSYHHPAGCGAMGQIQIWIKKNMGYLQKYSIAVASLWRSALESVAGSAKY